MAREYYNIIGLSGGEKSTIRLAIWPQYRRVALQYIEKRQTVTECTMHINWKSTVQDFTFRSATVFETDENRGCSF